MSTALFGAAPGVLLEQSELAIELQKSPIIIHILQVSAVLFHPDSDPVLLIYEKVKAAEKIQPLFLWRIRRDSNPGWKAPGTC
jgi:hypothetical protein